MLYRLKPIGYKGFLLGTDELGRDMLSRLIFGGRMSLLMGLVPVALATVVGGFLGVARGIYRRLSSIR
jgi:peptide/nickel transport system permease protein